MLSFGSRKKAKDRGEQVRKMMQHPRRWGVVAWKNERAWYYELRSTCLRVSIAECVKADETTEFDVMVNLCGNYPGGAETFLPVSKPHKDPQMAVNNHARQVVRFLRSAAESISAVIGPPRRPEKPGKRICPTTGTTRKCGNQLCCW